MIKLTKDFRNAYDTSWPRLIKGGGSQLHLFSSYETEKADASWDFHIVEHPRSTDTLRHHPVNNHELVVHICHPPGYLKTRPPGFEMKTFISRAAADEEMARRENAWSMVSLEFEGGMFECERRVAAVCQFYPGALPSNKVDGESSQDKDERDRARVKLGLNMTLHRALLKGYGFFEVCAERHRDFIAAGGSSTNSLNENSSNSITEKEALSILKVNFLMSDKPDSTAFSDALIDEALFQDRARLRKHLSNAPLGLVIITAVSGQNIHHHFLNSGTRCG